MKESSVLGLFFGEGEVVFFGNFSGAIILPTKTMHYERGTPANLTYICSVSFPPNW